MSELLKEVPQPDQSKDVLVEKHVYADKPGVAPCDSDDKACHQRWIEAFCDCDQ